MESISAVFDRAFSQTVGIEGGFSNNPIDRGGATKYGVTEALARTYGYTGDMHDLSLELAKHVAKVEFWDKFRGDDVATIAPSVATELFDIAYNCGLGIAGQFLQRCLNAFNHTGADYPDVTVDGNVGPGTIAALKAYAGKRGAVAELVLHRALESLKGARYIAIAEKDRTQAAFVFGWIRNRLGLA